MSPHSERVQSCINLPRVNLKQVSNLSRPGRNAAAIVLAVCGLASVYWAAKSGSQTAPAQSPATTEQRNPMSSTPAATTNIRAGILDLNTASAAELELLPGVGPSLAARIVEYREKNGPFKKFDELDKVYGFGPKMLEKIRPLVEVKDGA